MISPTTLPTFLMLLLTFSFAACGGKKGSVQQDKDVDPVLTQLNQQVEQSPKNDSLRYLRAEYFYSLDAFDEALNDLYAALQIDSMQPRNYHLLADVLLDYGRPNDSKRAILVLENAAEKFPNRLSTLLKLSEFYLIVRQHGDALKTLDKVLLRDPQNSEAYFMAGRVALDKEDTTNAIASLRQSLQFNADNPDGWIMLGRILTERKDPKALQCFDNALRSDSTLVEAQEFKGAYFKRMGDFEKAFEIYREIIHQNPNYANAFFDMGMMYLDQDSLKSAADHFTIAVKTDPLFVKAYYYRGLSLEMMGQVAEAKADYDQANRMAPGYKEPKEALERLK
jgi:tetratricopeptide (TPR) repeat protein